ncbi:unnamed protein product [Boreogadus saida]
MWQTGVALAVIYGIFIILGLIGNITLIRTFCSTKSIRNVPNLLMSSLALGDVLLLVTCAPVDASRYISEEWLFGRTGCKVIPFIQLTSVGVSVFTLTALSADRLSRGSGLARTVLVFVGCAVCGYQSPWSTCTAPTTIHRWNPRSELLQRKAFRSIGPTGSLDELERDAYRRRGEGGRPGDGHRGNEDEGDAGDRMELREFRRQLSTPCRRDGPPQRYRDDRGRGGEEEEEGEEDGRPRPRRERMKSDGGEPASPLASPTRRRGNSWDSERHRVPPPPAPRLSPPPSSSSTRDRDYDGDSFLGSLLERKAKLRGAGPGRGDQDSDSPSKLSSKLSAGESGRFRSRSPNGRRETDSTSKSSALASSNRREDPRDKPRKTNTLLSRDSLIV